MRELQVVIGIEAVQTLLGVEPINWSLIDNQIVPHSVASVYHWGRLAGTGAFRHEELEQLMTNGSVLQSLIQTRNVNFINIVATSILNEIRAKIPDA